MTELLPSRRTSKKDLSEILALNLIDIFQLNSENQPLLDLVFEKRLKRHSLDCYKLVGGIWKPISKDDSKGYTAELNQRNMELFSQGECFKTIDLNENYFPKFGLIPSLDENSKNLGGVYLSSNFGHNNPKRESYILC